MNIEINNYVKGKYIIENDKGEILAEFDNNITDRGMQAIAGHEDTQSNIYIFGAFFSSMNLVLSDNSTIAMAVFNQAFAVNGFPNYTNQVVTRTDGMLQINYIVKNKYVFLSNKTVKAIQIGAPHSIGVLPAPLTFNKSEAISVTYVLQYVTDCNKIITNMNFVTNHASGVLLPPNKTNVRTIPVGIFDRTYVEYTTSYKLYTPLHFPSGAAKFPYDRMALYFYSDVDIYNSMVSTTAQLTGAIPVSSSTVSWVLRKPVNSIKYAASGNTYSTSLRFIFEPGEWPTTAKGFSYIASDSPGTGVQAISERANIGIFTALQSPYNPYAKSADMVVGIDYKFTWTRAA